MTILHVYSNITISINNFNIIVTLSVYFENIKKLCKTLINTLHPYYKFVQIILLYFFKLLKLKFIII